MNDQPTNGNLSLQQVGANFQVFAWGFAALMIIFVISQVRARR